MNCRLLFNEEPITINRTAANVLGLNEAIVVQQIHYWLNINDKANINKYDGKIWTYNTYEKWQSDNFTFWSVSTLKRIFKKLFETDVLIKGNYNNKKYDRTLWVTLNYSKLEELLVEYEKSLGGDDVINTENTKNVEISTECQIDTLSDSNIVSDCYYAKCQVATMDSVNLTPPIPETTKDFTEISISTTEQVPVVEKETLVVDTNKELIENQTHLVIDSKNKEVKVSKWKKERLIKAIDIFKQQEGIYFSLLEKIYKDDKNFVEYNNSTNERQDEFEKTKFHNFDESFDKYTTDEFYEIVDKSQHEKYERPVMRNNNNYEINLRNRAIKELQANTFLEVDPKDSYWIDAINEKMKELRHN